MPLTPEHLEQLREARELLETPSLAARVTDLIGRPIEQAVRALPERAVRTIHGITQKALERALSVALSTVGSNTRRAASSGWHRLATATTGAMGGMFGLPGLALELPVTTVIMLRSIGDIARSEGQNLANIEVRMACLEVFALGGPSAGDDAAESGYWAVRTTLAGLVSDAAAQVAQHGAVRGTSPALVRLIQRSAARFGLVVEEKVALELVPVVGAVSGALINTVFMAHFQAVARGHFTVRRLEDIYGAETVRQAYLALGRS
jgi:hypothetical protein